MKGVSRKIKGSGIGGLDSRRASIPTGTGRIRYEKCGSFSTAKDTLTTRKNAVLKGEKLPADRPKALVNEITDAVLQDYRKNKRPTKHVDCRLKHILPFFGSMKANDVGND